MNKLLFKSKTFLYLSLFSIVALLAIEPAFAGSAGGSGLPYENWLTTFRDSITGPVALTLSLVGIVGAGGMLIFGGDLSGFMRTMVFIVLVTSMLVGAKSLLEKISGSGALVGAQTKQVEVINDQKITVNSLQGFGELNAENTTKKNR